MKKIGYALLTSTLLASTGTAQADSLPADPKTCANFNGFYGGLLVGYGSGGGNTKQYGTHTTAGRPAHGGGGGAPPAVPAVTTVGYTLSQVSTDGGNAGIVLGYGRQISERYKVYVGLDFSYTPFSNAQGKADLVKVSVKGSGDAVVRGGVIWGNTLVFGLIGMSTTKIVGQYQGENLVGRKFLNANKNGFVIGTGVDAKASPHITFGIDYRYYHFASSGKVLSWTGATPPPPPAGWAAGGVATPPTATVNAKTQLNNSIIRLRLVYQL